MFKYKLKEIELGDTETQKGKKTTVSNINPETGAITWDIEDVADFSSTYKELEKAKDFLSKLEKTGKSKDDPAIDKLAAQIKELFNTFRTHIRKNYPEEYKRVLRLKESVNEEYSDLDLYYRKGYKDFTGLVNRIVKEKDLEEKRKLMHVYVDILPKASREKKFKLKQSINKMGPNQIDKFAYNLLMRDSRMTSLQNESVNEGHGLDQVDLDYLQHIADKNPDDTKLEKIVKFLTKSNILVDKTKDLSKGKEVEEGTFHGPREIAIYDGSDGETYIEKRGTGYYGYNNSFDFEAEDKAELKWKLDSWGYRLIAGSIDEGEGIGYMTPDAFGKKKKNVYTSQYGYKLVPKKIKGSGMITKQIFEKEELTEYSDFQQKRINGFDGLEDKVNSILPLISNAKNETAEYYNENPGSYAVVYSTDMVENYLDNIVELLKQSEE